MLFQLRSSRIPDFLRAFRFAQGSAPMLQRVSHYVCMLQPAEQRQRFSLLRPALLLLVVFASIIHSLHTSSSPLAARATSTEPTHFSSAPANTSSDRITVVL